MLQLFFCSCVLLYDLVGFFFWTDIAKSKLYVKQFILLPFALTLIIVELKQTSL